MVLNLLLAFISSFNLGDTLASHGFYDNAIVEYRRDVFYKSSDSVELFTKIGNLLYKEGKYSRAAQYYSKAYSISNDDNTKYKLYKTLYKNGQYDILRSVLSDANRKNDSLLLAFSFARLSEYGKSSCILKKIGYDVKFTNPYFNKYVSYVIPGSGQILAGHFKDGLVAMVINGAFAYYGYYLYKSKDYITVALTIPLFLRFYLGNATAAWDFTIEKNNRIIDGLENKTGTF